MATVTLRGRFSPGTEVRLYRRTFDQFDISTAGDVVAVGKVARSGEVSFKDLTVGDRLWVAGQDPDGTWRGVAITVKAESEVAAKLSQERVAQRLAQTRPIEASGQQIVTGPRGTATARTRQGQPFANPKVGVPTPKDERVSDPAPYARLEDVPKGTPLRSHTVTGEAHVVNPDLPDGKLRQDQVPEGTPQASCTPLGEATIIGDEDQALARLENKVPASPAAESQEPKTAGIEAAQTGKVPAEAQRSAQGKVPQAPKPRARKPAARKSSARKAGGSTKSSGARASGRKASPKRK